MVTICSELKLAGVCNQIQPDSEIGKDLVIIFYVILHVDRIYFLSFCWSGHFEDTRYNLVDRKFSKLLIKLPDIV